MPQESHTLDICHTLAAMVTIVVVLSVSYALRQNKL
jgi:hypothetical protein